MYPFLSYYRVVIIVLSYFCLTSLCSNYNIINVTFICMKDDFSNTYQYDNKTRSIYDYTPNEKSSIIWAVAIGTLIATFPINYLYNRFGARYPFFICGILSVIATVLTPYAAFLGLPLLLFLRFVQGVAYSADFAVIGIICVRWAPLSELAIFIGVLTSFTPFSSVITNALSAQLCVSLGWRSAFYVHAIIATICFILWFIAFTDDPKDARFVNEKELEHIRKGKSKQHIEADTKEIPYKKLLLDPTVLTVWFNAFVELSVTILLSNYGPIYLNRVLGYSVQSTGYLLSITNLAQFPFKFSAAVCSDKLTIWSEIKKMLIFNTLAVGVPALLMLGLGLLPTSHSGLMVVLIGLFSIFSSLNCAGFYKCGTLHSRQFAHIVISTVQWMKCVALFTSPLLVSLLVTHEDSASEWSAVFITCGVLLLVANFISYITFTDKPAHYTEVPIAPPRKEVKSNV